jgi:hypothetical protein
MGVRLSLLSLFDAFVKRLLNLSFREKTVRGENRDLKSNTLCDINLVVFCENFQKYMVLPFCT